MRASLTFVLAGLALPAITQAPAKKVLSHADYDGWKSVATAILSRDGKYLAYVVSPQEGDGVLTVRRNADGATLDVLRGTGLRFTADSKFLVATQAVPFLEARQARRDKKPAADQPKPGLAIVDLEKWSSEVLPKVSAWSLAEDDRSVLAYRPEPPKPEPKKDEPKKEEAKKDDKSPKKKADHKAGDPLVLRTLATKAETTIPEVASFAWSKDGGTLATAISTKDGSGDGVMIRRAPAFAPIEVTKGMGRYTKLTLSENGKALAYLSDKDDYAAKKPVPKLYRFAGEVKEIVAPVNAQGWIVNENTTPRFSESGRRLIFGVGPKPVEDKEIPDDEKVSVDVWNWQDALLQPQQLLQAAAERTRTYDVVHEDGRSVLIEDEKVRNVTIPVNGDARWGYAAEDLNYGKLVSWEGSYEDLYRVDLRSGERDVVAAKVRGFFTDSPDGKWLAYGDEEARKVFAVELATGRKVEIVTGTPLYDELDDHPDFPGLNLPAGWSKDGRLVVQDRYDLFVVDPSGRQKTVKLTDGRPYGIVYRIGGFDKDDAYDLGDLLITSFNERNKDEGAFRLVNGKRTGAIPMQPKNFIGWTKAKDADTVVYRRTDVREMGDLWVTDADLKDPKKVTNVGAQVEGYNWLTSELVEWTSNDGVKLQGILFKPENFDPAKKYPMISYFYERNSDTLHDFRSPAPSASTINIPLFVSQGYLVFVPDIVYKVGYPGESAMSCIVSGVAKLTDERSYIDKTKLGIQGQSWGGYQVAYMITETDMFAAAGAGAPVSNMTSAYGGIRYGSGLVRQFQYEHQQSRIGGTPWNGLQRYIENSPLFFADKVKTPLLIMHNDKDGAVPYTQGIEYFTALRRLGKPSWMLVYNDEDHNLVQRKNRKDLSIRLSQFFDHFLKSAPAPDWLVYGVPAKDKGRTMGTEVRGG